MMHPDERLSTTAGDPEIRIEESVISSLLAHYSRFEEALGMNTARGSARSVQSPRPTRHQILSPSSRPLSAPKPLLRRASLTPQQDRDTRATSDLANGISAEGTSPPRYRGYRIAVVVPAYNEELLIEETLSSIPSFVEKIYVIDDCSKDATWLKIQKATIHDSRIVPFRHDVNKGVGAAIVTGYKAALADGIDIAAVMAGDNQMDPELLPQILDPIVDGTCDYTIGDRLISPEYRKGMSKWRFAGNAILTLLTKIASGYWQLMDSQNGYTAISSRALERINLDSLYPRYGYCNDLLVKLNVNGFRIKNVPHPARYGKEKSGIKYSTYIAKVSKLLLKDFLWRLKTKYMVLSFHPLIFFYIFGALLTGAGVISGIYTLYHKFIEGGAFFDRAIISLIVFGLGIQLLFFAMFFDMQHEKGENEWY